MSGVRVVPVQQTGDAICYLALRDTSVLQSSSENLRSRPMFAMIAELEDAIQGQL